MVFVDMGDFWDSLEEVEGFELQAKNYVEYMRIFCSRIKHHSNSFHTKEFYNSLRRDIKEELKLLLIELIKGDIDGRINAKI